MISTVERIQPRVPKRRSGTVGALVAGGTLIAVAIAAACILAFAGKGSSSTRSATGGTASSAPLIQYRGTGQPPSAPAIDGAPGAAPTAGLLRAEHSYGAVP